MEEDEICVTQWGWRYIFVFVNNQMIIKFIFPIVTVFDNLIDVYRGQLVSKRRNTQI